MTLEWNWQGDTIKFIKRQTYNNMRGPFFLSGKSCRKTIKKRRKNKWLALDNTESCRGTRNESDNQLLTLKKLPITMSPSVASSLEKITKLLRLIRSKGEKRKKDEIKKSLWNGPGSKKINHTRRKQMLLFSMRNCTWQRVSGCTTDQRKQNRKKNMSIWGKKKKKKKENFLRSARCRGRTGFVMPLAFSLIKQRRLN